MICFIFFKILKFSCFNFLAVIQVPGLLKQLLQVQEYRFPPFKGPPKGNKREYKGNIGPKGGVHDLGVRSCIPPPLGLFSYIISFWGGIGGGTDTPRTGEAVSTAQGPKFAGPLAQSVSDNGPSTHQPIDSSIQPINPSTHQLIESTHQLINPSINPSTH